MTIEPPTPHPQNLVEEEEGSPSKPQSPGSNPTASHALPGTTERRYCQAAPLLLAEEPRQTPPNPPRLCLPEKNNPQPSILRCQPPTQLFRGPGPARGAHTHPLGSHPDTYTNRAPSTRAHTHRGHAGTAAPLPHKGWRARGHTQPRAGTLAVPSPRRAPAAAHLHPRAPGAPWGPPLPASSRVGVRSRPPSTPLSLRCDDPRLQHPLPLRGPDRPRLPFSPPRPAHLAQVRRSPRLGPTDALTCPAPLWGRSCASFLRLRETGPPARHISRNRDGEKWVMGGGARAASVSPPSPGSTPPPPTKNFKKRKKKRDHSSKGGPLAAAAAAARGWGRASPRPSRRGRRQKRWAEAVSELRGLGRGGAPRGGVGRGPHLPRSSAAPTEVARVRPGDFPAPSDGSGGGRRVNGAAGEPLQPPATRRRHSRTRTAPSAGASSADGGEGAPQRRQLPRRRLGLPAVAAGGSGRGAGGAEPGGGAAGGRRGGVAPPGRPEGGRRAGPVGTAGRADRAGAGHQQ